MSLPLPLIVPWIRLDRDARAEEEAALRRAREPWCAGFCLFGGEADAVARLTGRLREAAGRPLFVASDMERGAGQQVKGLRVLPDAALWGMAASPGEIEAFGALTARDARSVGVDVLFAPVLDVRSEPNNPIVGNRAFGWDPDRVATAGAAFVRGALAGGCAPTGKHFPGHGATAADSHDAVPSVRTPAGELAARDLVPFAAAFLAGCPAVMTAHVAYPEVDPSGAIATFSGPILGRLHDLGGRDALVFTDALLMAGAATEGGETGAARRALRAGCHVLLIPSDPERLAAEVLDGADATLRRLAEHAAARVRAFTAGIARLSVPTAGAMAGLEATPGRVTDRAMRLTGVLGVPALARGQRVLVVDDDDTTDRGEVLARRGAAAGVEVDVVRIRRDQPPPPVPSAWQPAAILLMSSVRAWKGHPICSQAATDVVIGVSRRAERGSTVVISLAPRPLLGSLHVPATGPDVESALADRLFPA
ncbi:MAG: glycoside hydrolase family 3 N-terminal domain-containing protein [Planctomycetota bacterium]